MGINNYEKTFLLSLYQTMLKERRFDQKLIGLLHEGKVGGFYHSGLGHEAIAAGVCSDLLDKDYLFYHHRGCNQQIAKGISLEGIYADFMGRIDGTTKGLGAGIVHHVDSDKGILGQSGTIGESYILSAGVGYSIKLRGTDQVCVAFNGDGASAREVFHGGLNWAGLYKLPVIFVIENNKFGSSMDWKKNHSLKDGGSLADRAESYNIPSRVVDGNDVLEVYEAAKEAIIRARNGEGPSLIEAMTYRYRGHYEGDPAEYMDENVTKEWKEKRDPIKKFKEKLLEFNIASQEELIVIENEIEQILDEAISKAEKSPIPEKERIYQGLFA